MAMVSPQRHTRSWWLAAGCQQCPEMLGSRLLKLCAGQAGIPEGSWARSSWRPQEIGWLPKRGHSPRSSLQASSSGLLAFVGSPRKQSPCQRPGAPPRAGTALPAGSRESHSPRTVSLLTLWLGPKPVGPVPPRGAGPTPSPASALVSPGQPRWGHWRVPGLWPAMSGRCLCLGPSLGLCHMAAFVLSSRGDCAVLA